MLSQRQAALADYQKLARNLALAWPADAAPSAALLVRLLRRLGNAAQYYIPDRLLEGDGPSAEALVRLEAAGWISGNGGWYERVARPDR